MEYDVVIVGAGPIGIFSAFQAGMLGMKVCVVDAAKKLGGQCSMLYPTKPIYDIPGYYKITANELVNNLIEQASRFNPNYILEDKIFDIKKINQKQFEITTFHSKKIRAKAVLIAAGSGEFVPNKPPIQNIENYENKSVFYNVIDKNLFKDQTILIAGGGDSAVDWSLELLPIVKKIYLVHRRKNFKASQSNIEHLKRLVENNPDKIEIIAPFQLYDVQGINDQIKKVIVEDLNNKKISLEVNSMLLFFGLVQNIGNLANIGLQMQGHYIEVDPFYYQTNIDHIYAIGDVAHYPGKLKLILTGFAEASSALYHMYPRIFDNKQLHFEYSTTKFKKL